RSNASRSISLKSSARRWVSVSIFFVPFHYVVITSWSRVIAVLAGNVFRTGPGLRSQAQFSHEHGLNAHGPFPSDKVLVAGTGTSNKRCRRQRGQGRHVRICEMPGGCRQLQKSFALALGQIRRRFGTEPGRL